MPLFRLPIIARFLMSGCKYFLSDHIYSAQTEDDLSTREGVRELEPTVAERFYKRYHQLQPLPVLEIANDQEYITAVNEYLRQHHLDTSKDPLLEILGVEQARAVLKQCDDKFGKLSWTEWDYGVVALSALLAILVDFFIVRIPWDMNFKGQEYKGSPVTKFLNKQSDMIMGKAPSAGSDPWFCLRGHRYFAGNDDND